MQPQEVELIAPGCYATMADDGRTVKITVPLEIYASKICPALGQSKRSASPVFIGGVIAYVLAGALVAGAILGIIALVKVVL